jgi:hypothetical protein
VENTWSLIGDPMWRKLSKPRGLKGESKDEPILAARHIENVAWMNKQLEIPQRVTLKNGSTIDFKSGEAGREAFEGAEYDGVWIDEELADSLVFQEIQRGLIDRGGKLWWTATPLARSRSMLELHEDAHDPEALRDVYETQLSIFDNPYLDDAARDAFVASIPEDYRSTRLYGEFLILEGLVYGEWDRHLHEISRQEFREYDQRNPRAIVIDPGYADPCAILWAMLLPGTKRKVIAYREYYHKRRTVTETVKAIARLTGAEPLTAAIIDRESRKRNQSGAASLYDQYCDAFKKFGIRSAITGQTLTLKLAATDIASGIYTFKEFLQPDEEGMPSFYAVDDLTNFKKELGRYRWGEETERKDIPSKPIDKDNHLLDCARYLLQNLPRYRCSVSEETSASERLFNEAQRIMSKDRGGSISIGG